MIHYITVGVARERPPKTDEYRRYAIYGGTHQEAELVATQMAACTSTMPVSVERDPSQARVYDCLTNRCTVATPVEPHGALGCRCWPAYLDVEDWVNSDDEPEHWLISDDCPLHGRPKTAEKALREVLAYHLYDDNLRRFEDDVLAGRVGGKVDRGPAGACGCACTACYEYCEVPPPACGANAMDCPGPVGEQCLSPQLNKERRGLLAAIKRRVRRWHLPIWDDEGYCIRCD